jgi:hypothetical protein
VHGPYRIGRVVLYSVRPRRSGRKGRIEIEIEARIELEAIALHVGDMDSVIAFAVHLAEASRPTTSKSCGRGRHPANASGESV